jgi:hypothetical protein
MLLMMIAVGWHMDEEDVEIIKISIVSRKLLLYNNSIHNLMHTKW